MAEPHRTLISNWHEKRQDPPMFSLFIHPYFQPPYTHLPPTFFSLLPTHFLPLTIHPFLTPSFFQNLGLGMDFHPFIFYSHLLARCHKPSHPTSKSWTTYRKTFTMDRESNFSSIQFFFLFLCQFSKTCTIQIFQTTLYNFPIKKLKESHVSFIV